MRRVWVVILACLSLAVLPAAAHGARTVFTGQWLCDDRGVFEPLGGMELQLWHRGSPDFLPVEWVGGVDQLGFTNPDGTFALTAVDSEDNHFVRNALRDGFGVHLKDFWGINDWSVDVGVGRNDTAARDIGGLLLTTPGQSHKCAIWRGVHLAHQDFRAITGASPRGGGVLINADAVTAGVPFSPNTEIWWPGGFPTGYSGGGDDSITRHEFAHTFRAGYDGDLGHFLGDVVTHNYLQNHEACNKTGLGFAFNEGWAEYWARDYAPAPACEGRTPDDYEVEGNVAAALADLEARCFAGNRAPMVAVLRDNPGVIHSFQEFRDHVSCPISLVLAPPPPASAAPIRVNARARADLARAQVRATDAALRRLRGRLVVADRRARIGLSCPRTPCNAALRRAMEPAVLRSQIDLMLLVRHAVDDYDTVKEQGALGRLSVKDILQRNRLLVRTLRADVARASADGLRNALAAGGPVFARDRSAATRRLRARLRTRMAAFRRAQRGGPLPAGLNLDQVLAAPAGKVPERPFPNPEPVTDLRSFSAVTISCPAGSKVGGINAINGTLVPTRAGATVDLHVTPPGGAETVQHTTVDAGGHFSGSVATITAGTWTVVARFAGDLLTRPADSPVCTFPVA